MSEDILKENFTAKLDAGSVSPDDVDGTKDAIEAVLLSGLSAVKARGFSSANLTLIFKCSTKG